MFSLDERLSLCASFVREGTSLADIGTDHGYLPIWLLLNEKIEYAVAADIRRAPLESARANIEKYNLTDRIKTVLSDGLDNIKADQADDIVMAGMGGELIVRLIDRTPWLRTSKKNLILQPMTRAEVLRKYLCLNGFWISEEKTCISCGKSYCVMLASYDGTVRPCSVRYSYIGSLDTDKSPEAKRYIYTVNEKLKKKLRGYTNGTDEYDSLKALISGLTELINSEESKW